MITLCEAKNRYNLQDYLCEHNHMQRGYRSYARKSLRQIRHMQNMAETIVGLITIYDIHDIYEWELLMPNDNYPITTLNELRSEVQGEVNKFIANIEHFNEFMRQSKVTTVDNFNGIARELKEANQPILDNLAAIRNEVISNIK